MTLTWGLGRENSRKKKRDNFPDVALFRNKVYVTISPILLSRNNFCIMRTYEPTNMFDFPYQAQQQNAISWEKHLYSNNSMNFQPNNRNKFSPTSFSVAAIAIPGLVCVYASEYRAMLKCQMKATERFLPWQ